MMENKTIYHLKVQPDCMQDRLFEATIIVIAVSHQIQVYMILRNAEKLNAQDIAKLDVLPSIFTANLVCEQSGPSTHLLQ